MKKCAGRLCAYVTVIVMFASAAFAAAFATDYTTFHFDNWRTGWNPNETVLVPSLLSGHFGRYMSVAVDGEVDAQPLYVASESIPGQGTHSLAIIATENDSLYAIDAASGTVIWQTNFGTPVTVDTAFTGNCAVPNPYAGILSTPVIVRSSDTIYALAYTTIGSTPTYQLHALSLGTGLDKYSPFTFGGSTPGLNAAVQAQRPALLYSNGAIYVGFGSFCDHEFQTSAGQIYAFGSSLNLAGHFAASYDLGSLWGAGFGPAADAQGNVYFATGNGMTLFSRGSYAQSVLKMAPALKSMLDFFAPTSAPEESGNDLDLSSGGVMLLPDQYGPYGSYAHLMVAGGKTGTTFLLNRDNLGKWAAGAPDNIPYEVRTSSNFFGGPCYWRDASGNNYLGISGSGQPFSAYLMGLSPLSLTLWSRAPNTEYLVGEGGDTCTVSSNGPQGGTAIVWVVDGPASNANGVNGAMYLEAFDASNPAQGYLFNAQAGLWGNADGVSPPAYGAPFGSATVADGRVIVASNKMVTFWDSH